MRILVTGSAGFIGSWVAESLIAKGHQVLGVDDFSGGENELCPTARVDLRDKVRTGEVVHGFRPEVLVHLAANAREGASQFQPFEVATRNLSAYASVLEASIAADVRRVVLFSSMAVYGDQKPPFGEFLEPRPVDVYATCKAAMERMTRILSEVHGYRWAIVRPHNVFGERQCLSDRFRNVVAIFMNRIMRGEPLYVYGDGEQRRAFSYISNSLPCYIRLVLDDSIHGLTVNVGGTVAITVNRLAEIVADAMGGRPEIIHLPPRPLEVKDAWCAWGLSESVLDFKEPVNLGQGIRRMAEWAKGIGPRPWSEERLALINEKTPKTWI